MFEIRCHVDHNSLLRPQFRVGDFEDGGTVLVTQDWEGRWVLAREEWAPEGEGFVRTGYREIARYSDLVEALFRASAITGLRI